MQTSTIAQHFTRAAALGVANEATSKQGKLQRAIDDTVRAFRDLHECGVCPNYLDDCLAGLLDAASNADSDLRSDIDNAGFHAEHVDLSEAETLLEKVRA
jgi:hypothetical protein